MKEHYCKTFKGILIDAYRVAILFDVTHPARFQCLKKILRAGTGAKTLAEDIDEIIEGAERWKQMIAEEE